MEVIRAYRFELYPNNKQRTLMVKSAGVARFAYNWGLSQRIELHRVGKTTDAMKQHKHLNKLKQTSFSWMYEVSKCCPQEALRDLERAFTNFFTGKDKDVGFPRFKKKYRHDSFRLTGRIRLIGEGRRVKVKLPRFSLIRLKEKKLPAILMKKIEQGTCRITSATVSRVGQKWFVSFRVVEKLDIPPIYEGETVGVDLGLRQYAYLSNGISIPNPKFLNRKLSKLRRLSKSLSRKQKYSRNYRKAALKIARLHANVRNSKLDFIHKLTSYLSKNHRYVVIEDLSFDWKKLYKNVRRAFSEVNFSEFRRQLEYKCDWYGSELIVADKFYPSSKLCSACGAKYKNFSLDMKVYECRECGANLHRDLNAALNLRKYSLSRRRVGGDSKRQWRTSHRMFREAGS